jgi:hypothetical protein
MTNNSLCTTYDFRNEVDPTMGIDIQTSKKERKRYQLVVAFLEGMEKLDNEQKLQR